MNTTELRPLATRRLLAGLFFVIMAATPFITHAAPAGEGWNGEIADKNENAAGNSGWHSARGFSAWVAPGASETSRRLAAALSSGAAAIGYSGNRSSPPCGYWTGNFAILRDTLCPAVLSENMFMDNVADLAFLKSPRSVEILAALHAKVLAEIIPDI